MSEPKQCPFCGFKLVQIKGLGDNYRHPDEGEAKWCVVHGVVTDIEQWNTRPAEDALRAEVERLQRELAVSNLALELNDPIEQERNETIQELQARVRRVEEVAAKYDGLAQKLKNNCQCCGCYDCSAWRIYELVEDDITAALKGPQ